jgi:hypothetical protein
MMHALRMLGSMAIVVVGHVLTAAGAFAHAGHDHSTTAIGRGSTGDDGSWLTVVAIVAVAALVLLFNRHRDKISQPISPPADHAPTRQ